MSRCRPMPDNEYGRRLRIMQGLHEERRSGPNARRGASYGRCVVPVDAPNPNAPGIYYLQGERIPLIKIGIAKHVQLRISALQSGSPDRLILLAVDWHSKPRLHVEQQLHRRFEASRVHGEWFEPTPELLAHIALVADSGGIQTHPQGIALQGMVGNG